MNDEDTFNPFGVSLAHAIGFDIRILTPKPVGAEDLEVCITQSTKKAYDEIVTSHSNLIYSRTFLVFLLCAFAQIAIAIALFSALTMAQFTFLLLIPILLMCVVSFVYYQSAVIASLRFSFTNAFSDSYYFKVACVRRAAQQALSSVLNTQGYDDMSPSDQKDMTDLIVSESVNAYVNMVSQISSEFSGIQRTAIKDVFDEDVK